MVDFVNAPADILAAFKKYHPTAELSGVTDPHIIYDLRTKLDAQALYGSFEVDRVVQAAVLGKMQSAIDVAITPVADRLLKRYKAAQETLNAYQPDAPQAVAAKNEMEVLILFKRDIGTYVLLYAFLSQIFDYALIMDAVMDALSAFSSMSKQALESAKIRADI